MNFELHKTFCEHNVKIENILKLWRMRQLALGGTITVFKSFKSLNCIIIQLIFSIKYRKTLFDKGKR